MFSNNSFIINRGGILAKLSYYLLTGSGKYCRISFKIMIKQELIFWDSSDAIQLLILVVLLVLSAFSHRQRQPLYHGEQDPYEDSADAGDGRAEFVMKGSAIRLDAEVRFLLAIT